MLYALYLYITIYFSVSPTGSAIPWILFGVSLTATLALAMFVVVICCRHGSLKMLLGTNQDRVGSNPPETPHNGGPELQIETHVEMVGRPPYESLKDQVCKKENVNCIANSEKQTPLHTYKLK